MTDKIEFWTPVGRIVQGHPLTLSESDQSIDPTTGQKKTSYYTGLAIPKEAFMAEVWPQLTAAAQRDWPGGQFNASDFSWKMFDGDGVDKNGQPYSQREGMAGCYILRISSQYPYPVATTLGGGQTRTVTEPGEIKRGYFGRFYIEVKGNASRQSPGVYVNPRMFQWTHYGEEIVGGPDVSAMMASAPQVSAAPAGAMSTPAAGTAPPPTPGPATPAATPAVPQPAHAPSPAAAPAIPGAQAGVAPHPGILQPPQ